MTLTYTRSYFGSGEGSPSLPSGYDGIAFEDKTPEKLDTPPAKAVEEEEKIGESVTAGSSVDVKGDGILASLFSPLRGIFKGGGGGSLFPFRLGYEEILIIATAAFLFFSADGDRECALILLLLLIIN